MRGFFRIFLLFFVISLFSCVDSGGGSGGNSITVGLPGSGSERALLPSGKYEKSDTSYYVVNVVFGDKIIASKIISYGDTDARFEALPSGEAVVVVTAYSLKGDIVAQGSAPVLIMAEAESYVSIILNFVIHELENIPTVSVAEFATKFPGNTNTLTEKLGVNISSYDDLVTVRTVINLLDKTDNIVIGLESDINVNSSGFVPMCTDINRGFTGIFNGKGHTITMGSNNGYSADFDSDYTEEPESHVIYTALFMYLGCKTDPEINFSGDAPERSIVKNVKFAASSTINGTVTSSGPTSREVFCPVAVSAYHATIERCWNAVSAAMISHPGMGGLVLNSNGSQFLECLNTGTLQNKWNGSWASESKSGFCSEINFAPCGGICARAYKSYFFACASSGSVTCTSSSPNGSPGQIMGCNSVNASGTITSDFLACYYTLSTGYVYDGSSRYDEASFASGVVDSASEIPGEMVTMGSDAFVYSGGLKLSF